MIYFIEAPECSAIKIGWTKAKDCCKRMSTIQTSIPGRLVLVGVLPGDKTRENALHGRFSALHISGEWFRSDAALVAFINNECDRPPVAPKVKRENICIVSPVKRQEAMGMALFAKMCCMPVREALAWIKAEGVPHYHVGTEVVIPAVGFQHWVNTHNSSSPARPGAGGAA